MTQNLNNHPFYTRLCLALVCVLLLGAASSITLAQVPNLRFSTDGAGTSSDGDASSSDGALRGNVKFKFNGYIRNGLISIGSVEVKLPTTPSGTRFYRVKDSGFYGAFNRPTGDYPVVTYSTSDPSFNTLVISNLKGSEHYSNTSGRWAGRIKVTLKFSKVAGVADRFRVEFTPQTPHFSPPPYVSGLISAAVVKTGSNLILQ